jgi:hypothetical protein
MTGDDQELNAALERIRHLQSQLAHLRRVETNPANYHLSASGFLAEIDRMQLARGSGVPLAASGRAEGECAPG